MPSQANKTDVANGRQPLELPAWLVPGGMAPYEPKVAREGFLRKNVLALTRLLARVRVGSRVGQCDSAIDRMLARVAVPARLLGLLVLLGCTSAAANMAFAYLMLGVSLVMLAARPAGQIAPVARTAGVVALVTALVMLPAALLGQPTSAVRMATKAFATVSLALGLFQHVSWSQVTSALRWLRLPSQAVFVLDMTLRDIELLGRAALELSDALALRSVGVARDATAGAAGVMGMTFLRAHELAARQSEAMRLRGFDGSYEPPRERVLTPATLTYVVVVVGLVCVFVYLEGAM